MLCSLKKPSSDVEKKHFAKLKMNLSHASNIEKPIYSPSSEICVAQWKSKIFLLALVWQKLASGE